MPQSGAGTGTGPATLVISSEEDEKVSRKTPLKTPMKSPPGPISSKMEALRLQLKIPKLRGNKLLSELCCCGKILKQPKTPM